MTYLGVGDRMYQSEAAGFRPGYSHTLAPKQGATSSQPDPPHTRDLCWLLWVTTDLGGPVDTGLAGVSTLRGRQYGGTGAGSGRTGRRKGRVLPPSSSPTSLRLPPGHPLPSARPRTPTYHRQLSGESLPLPPPPNTTRPHRGNFHQRVRHFITYLSSSTARLPGEGLVPPAATNPDNGHKHGKPKANSPPAARPNPSPGPG